MIGVGASFGAIALMALQGGGAVVIPPPLTFTGLASNWDGSALPFGSIALSQDGENRKPVLGADDWLTFNTAFIGSTDAAILDVMDSGAWEVSVLYRPNEISQRCLWSAGDSTTNSDNTIFLYTLTSGGLRLYIDGNGGGGPQSFTASDVGMVIGESYLITCYMKNGSFGLRVNGVDHVVDAAVTGLQPAGMDQFAVGCRWGASDNNHCGGSFRFIEVVAL